MANNFRVNFNLLRFKYCFYILFFGLKLVNLKNKSLFLWFGKPFIYPKMIANLAAVSLVAVLVVWLEFYFKVAYWSFLSVALYFWTALAFLIVAFASVLHLIILYASNLYLLGSDGLEVKQGLISIKLSVVTASGFSDLDVYQSGWGRIFGYGDVSVRSKGDKVVRLVLVRLPLSVAEQMRSVLGSPRSQAAA